MSDLVLWGASYMVHLQWIDTHVATLLVACGGFRGGDNVLDSTLLMVHFSCTDIRVAYVLIRCALFVLHELILCCYKYAPHGSSAWSDIHVGHGTEKWRMWWRKILSKKSFGDDGAHNPLQIPLKVCFGPRPHGISWPFSNDRCSQNTERVAKTIAHCCWKCWFRQGPRAPVLPCFEHGTWIWLVPLVPKMAKSGCPLVRKLGPGCFNPWHDMTRLYRKSGINKWLYFSRMVSKLSCWPI